MDKLQNELCQLDTQLHAMEAVSDLLCACPACHQVNANSLGHLLHLISDSMGSTAKKMDTIVEALENTDAEVSKL